MTPLLGYSAPNRAYPLATQPAGLPREPGVRARRRSHHRDRLGPVRTASMNDTGTPATPSISL